MRFIRCFLLALGLGSLALVAPVRAAQSRAGQRDAVREAAIEQALAKIEPTLVPAFHAASGAFDEGDFAQAEKLYAQVLDKAPDFDAALRRRGTCLVALGRKQEGLQACERAVALNRSAANLITLATNRALPRTGQSTVEERNAALKLLREAQKLPQGDGVDTLVVMAQITGQDGDAAGFREAVTQLRAKFPAELGTKYLSAVLHAQDEEWVRAEDDMRAAMKLGLSPETGQRFLDSGVHSRAVSWRIALYAVYVVGAWLAGLVLLFTLGFALSRVVLRHTRTMGATEAVSEGERRLRGIYRAVINVAGVYYYISLPVVVVMVIGAFLAIFYAFFAIGWVPIKLTLLLGIGALVTIWAMVKSLFLKVDAKEPGRALTRDEAPELWQLTGEVARTLGTRPIDEIRVTPGTELAVYERGSWREKLQNRAHRILILGTGVLNGFKQDAFRSVLAHEYGHFSNRDTAGGDIALRVQNDMIKFYVAMLQQGQATYLNLAFHFLRAYHFIFRRISHGATRLQEVLADRVAAQTYGAAAFESGLRHVIARSIEFHDNANREIEAGLKAKRPLQSLYEPTTAQNADQLAEYEKAINRDTTEDDTHPSPRDRFQLVARLTQPAVAPRAGEVWELFKDRTALVAEMMQRIETDVARHREG